MCSETYGVGAIFREGNRCAEGQILLDCAGNIVERRRFTDYAADFCPTALGAWLEFCDKDLASGVGLGAGLCRLVDYYGQRVDLVIRVPTHRFRITPWPIGFVAREDPWGVFHPSARLIWELPPIPHADSGWRLWTWGSSRGPGEAAFPCFWSEEKLWAEGVPGGTTCVRLQLWAVPGLEGRQNPQWVRNLQWGSGRLMMPGIRLERGIYPGEEVVINSPYASHPAVNEWFGIKGGVIKGVRLIQGPDLSQISVFVGYFHIPWWVRVRAEIRRVKDLTEERERCEPVRDADGDEKPDGSGDCWAVVGDPPVVWPGVKRQERVVVRKEWEVEERDDVLNLTLVERPYEYRPKMYPFLHPVRLEIVPREGPVGVTGVVVSQVPWLWFPLGVREAQSVICADPTCGGYAPSDHP
ncbi:MAG TPA: hypothetical protein VNK89_11195 [Thermoflexus sp.]|nr:hypothetical protein [Thermoflexus sp.]